MPQLAKRTRQAALRRAVFERDHGRCAECGVDCVALLSAYRAAKAHIYGAWRTEVTRAVLNDQPTAACIAISLRHRGEVKGIEDRLRRLGFTPGHSFGEVDHTVPLEEGGADTLENMRWLCVPCHRRATAEHAARRARRPSKRVARRAA